MPLKGILIIQNQIRVKIPEECATSASFHGEVTASGAFHPGAANEAGGISELAEEEAATA